MPDDPVSISPDALLRLAAESAVRARSDSAERDAQPFEIAPVSTWTGRTPPPRAWTWTGWIPAGRVTLLMGDGGVGKSIVAQTVMTACASGRGELYGSDMASGVVLGIFSEEEQDELERRQRPICDALGVDMASLEDLHLLSRFGQENLIATYHGGIAMPTEFFWQIDATCARLRPHLVALDPAADFYGGNPISTSEVRQLVQVVLGGLCLRHGCAVLLPMHPSAAGIASGEGGGFSVAWSNSARSRLYLEHSKGEGDAEAGRVILTRKKANYAVRGEELRLVYDSGAFVPEARGVVEAIQSANGRKAILGLLAGCERMGRRVASSPKANENAAVILGERDGYPREFRGRGKSALFALLRRLQEDGAIEEATVKNASRHDMGIWRLTDQGRSEASA